MDKKTTDNGPKANQPSTQQHTIVNSIHNNNNVSSSNRKSTTETVTSSNKEEKKECSTDVLYEISENPTDEGRKTLQDVLGDSAETSIEDENQTYINETPSSSDNDSVKDTITPITTPNKESEPLKNMVVKKVTILFSS